jgi:hypothetical protein
MQKLAKTVCRIRVPRFATKVKNYFKMPTQQSSSVVRASVIKTETPQILFGQKLQTCLLGSSMAVLRQRLKTIFIFVDSWTKLARRFVTGKHY